MTSILHSLWRMSFQACVIIAIVLTARQLIKRYSGFYTRLLWFPVIVRLLCPVFIETDYSLLPDFPFAQADGEISGSTNTAPDVLTTGCLAACRFASGIQKYANKSAVKTDTGTESHPSPPPHTDTQGILASRPVPDTWQRKTGHSYGLAYLLAVLHLLGSITTALIFWGQFLILKHRISAAVCENGNIWLCENIASPFVIGILRPRIILPYHMEAEARAHVLSHEQTHIRHLDPLLHLTGLACVCLHWWNPFVWLAMHKMNQDMEMFCDESTLRLAADRQRKDYARTLLSFAEQQGSLHVGSAFSESNTERRVKNIMKKRKKNLLILGLVIMLTVFCSVAFMTVPKAAKNDAAPENNNVTPAEDDINTTPSTIQPGHADGSDPDISAESTLTGSFIVTGYFIPPRSNATGISQEEIDGLIGTQIKFTPASLRVGEHTYSVSECKKELVTAREFDDLFQLSTEEDLSLSTTAFDYYSLKTSGNDLPFGSHVYCSDHENALVVYKDVIFKISALVEDSYHETVFDQLADAHFSLPDKNGFVEGKLIPELMLPESILYYTDDTHYIIVKGGIALDTPQKAEEYFAGAKANALAAALSGISLIPAERPENGMNVTYSGDGGISHLYPRDYPREKLADGMLNWCYEDETCRAVVAGLDTAAPSVYYQNGKEDWKIFPLDGFQNLTEEERKAFVLISVTADTQNIRVVFTRDGEEIVKDIKTNR